MKDVFPHCGIQTTTFNNDEFNFQSTKNTFATISEKWKIENNACNQPSVIYEFYTLPSV